IDGGGFLNVGPQSAGADPGPVCYGRGGTRPTVTDADLVCGFLNPEYFLGGAQVLDIKAARAALAAAVAQELGMRRILVPPRPGAFSALGLLCTDVVHDYIRSELKPLAEVTPAHAEEIFAKLEHEAREELRAEGMSPSDGRFARELDLRYTGQGYELR